MQKIKLQKEPSLRVKQDAFEFQFEAVEAVKDLEYTAIFHEQGLGKSKIAIDIMLYWLETKVVDTVLFVAKKALLNNWEHEFKLHTYLKPRMLTQDRMNNYYSFNSPSRLMLTNYEVLKSEKSRFKLFLKAREVAIILDESTKIKNPDSSITKAIFELAPLFKKRVIMTGTPVSNRPYDIWAQIWFLDMGKSLDSDYLTFKKNNDLDNKLSKDQKRQKDYENNIEKIFHKISGFTVRKTKKDNTIQLPEKSYEKIVTDWESNQKGIYNQIKNEMRAIVIHEGIPTLDKSDEILKRLLRLVQTASNPNLFDEGYHAIPGKYEYLEDLVTKIKLNNEKAIIWSAFIKNVEWLYFKLKSFKPLKIHGKLTIDVRNKAVEKFISNNENTILIATPGAAKEGLTLTIANHVIFYDRTFSLDDYLQAQDRIHRISQRKRCYVYTMIMRDSIDEWIDILIRAKHLSAQLAQGDISAAYYKTQISYDFGTIIKKILGIEE